MELDLGFVNALRLIIPQEERLNLVLVGCGGTGSWLAPAVVRIVKLLTERGRRVGVCFVDPDAVENKNLYRQNFCQAEIGLNKAEALAVRYSLAWGVEIGYLPYRYSTETGFLRNNLSIMIGCVDNHAARQEIRKAMDIYGGRANWWLDCGNTKNAGQVLLGGGYQGARHAPLPGYVSWLPLPSEQHPELLRRLAGEEPHEENLSCAEMALQDSQGLAINQRMAAEAADYLVRMLITGDLRKYATYIDLESGASRSKYIHNETPGQST